jgi:hypothetical protein
MMNINDINVYLNKKHDLKSVIKYVESFNTVNNFDNCHTKIKKYSKWCDEISCTNKAKYGVLQNYPIYCYDHRDIYMFDVLSKKCKYQGCIIQPTFGYSYCKPEYCKKHSNNLMFNVKMKLCTSKNCTTKATYCIKPKSNLIFCRLHKTDSMIRIYKK